MWFLFFVLIIIIFILIFKTGRKNPQWIGPLPKKNAIFTSFGENHNIRHWNSQPEIRQFDIIGVYYGTGNPEKELVSKFFQKKGGKFQNFCFFYNKYPILFHPYEYIAIWDDDIIINTSQINEIFRIMRQHHLTIGMPSFSEKGKISHPHTLHRPDRFLTYTNFIEMNVPVFHQSVLPMLVSPPFDKTELSVCNLTGWGIDHVYMNLLSDKKKYRSAVIHKISCINPHDREKSGSNREIDQLESTESRIRAYQEVKNRTGIQDIVIQEYETI